MAKDKKFYVSNKDLYAEYVAWHVVLLGNPDAEIPAPIVDAMMKICTRLSYNPKFINYTFKDDMISDALYDCIRFAKKFNPEKGNNPFSYITTIAIMAFYRRIDAEKTQSYIKAKIVSESLIHEFYESIDDDDIELQQSFNDIIADNANNMANNEPMTLKRKRKKLEEQKLLAQDTKEGPLDKFYV